MEQVAIKNIINRKKSDLDAGIFYPKGFNARTGKDFTNRPIPLGEICSPLSTYVKHGDKHGSFFEETAHQGLFKLSEEFKKILGKNPNLLPSSAITLTEYFFPSRNEKKPLYSLGITVDEEKYAEIKLYEKSVTVYQKGTEYKMCVDYLQIIKPVTYILFVLSLDKNVAINTGRKIDENWKISV